MTTNFLAGEILTAAALNAAIDAGPQGIIAWGQRTSSSTATTTEIGVLRLDDISLSTLRAFRVWTPPLNFTSSTSTDDVRCRIRFTADGSTPTTSSTILPGSTIGANINGGGAKTPIIPISTKYAPAGGNELFSCLLCVTRNAGAGSASIFGDATVVIEIIIEDIGMNVTDVGTDI